MNSWERSRLSDGERSVLCSGFWGVSRHVNYLGEILMATGLTLVLGWPLVIGPWLYPLYYVALLVPRERADDRRCAAKYGPLWERYRAKVPSAYRAPGLLKEPTRLAAGRRLADGVTLEVHHGRPEGAR